MTPDKSTFETKPPKLLVKISLLLLEKNFLYESPFLRKNYSANFAALDNVLTYFSEFATDIDLQFFAKFISTNLKSIEEYQTSKNPESLSNIVIPTSSNYQVKYQVSGGALVIEKWKTEWSSYDENWVERSITVAYNDGSFDYWDGHHIDTETENFESDNFEVLEVGDDNYENMVNESTLNKLDKKTLLELKRVIDNRLRQL